MTKYKFDTFKINTTKIYKNVTANQLKCAIQNRKRRYNERYSYRSHGSVFKVTRLA